MIRRPLGRSGLSVAPLAFGGNVFGWTADEPTSFRLLDAFVDAGFDLVDTADVYSYWVPGNKGGESESIIGRWLAKTGKRARIVLATKVGMAMGEGGPKGLSRARVVAAVEDSLRRLQTDHIDLYQSHVDDEATPLAETLEAYAALVKAGKVRAIGASNLCAGRLREAHGVSETRGLPRYEVVQPWYNLLDRFEFEAELAPLCRERGVGVIPYFPLASGFLTGKYRSAADFAGRPRAERLARYDDARGWRVLEALRAVAAEAGATPAQAALAWLLAKKAVTAPIASATSVEQLEELFGAVRLVLSPAALARLDAASSELRK
ncbi:MAG: aldo/keto reductase [Elusimicrobia bacterium]|nr:aldo/keto reductase [Elusimicrobiota bacterium]